LAVALDVVYNHFGPEGNVLPRFGPYLTDRYRTPWGDAMNVDGDGSDEVRRFLIGNALEWFEDHHVDALRLDAVHSVVDTSARPFLLELAEATDALADRLGRRLTLIAESDDGNPRLVAPPELGGFGLDAQWVDDFHHAVHALLTGERTGYYADFGSPDQVAVALRRGFVYEGQRSVARGRRHGAPPIVRDARRVVVAIQNHDQVGNRRRGERLGHLAGPARARLAAGMLLLSPFVPLLFMGEEYAEDAPFHYFVSHANPELVEATRRGRAEEFAGFEWEGETPDAADDTTFLASKLDETLAHRGEHAAMRELYRELLRLRRDIPALWTVREPEVETALLGDVVVLRRASDEDEVLALFNPGQDVSVCPSYPGRSWSRLLDTAGERWGGPGGSCPEAVELTGSTAMQLRAEAFVLLWRPRGDG
jgi:maltooligosyltrehalose trehalohydrolase